jgi:hypothetical protein
MIIAGMSERLSEAEARSASAKVGEVFEQSAK